MIECKNVCFSYRSNSEDTEVSQNEGILNFLSKNFGLQVKIT